MVDMETVQRIATVVLDVIVMLVTVIYSFGESLVRLFIPPEERSVTRDIVLITGAAQGIGKELSKQYGALGATVVCVDINEGLNDQTVNELKKLGVKAKGYKCDVTNRQEVLNLGNRIRADVGDVSILVNNAGIMPCKRFLDHTETDIKRLFDLNIIAHHWLLEAFLPAMMAKNEGNVVALSSIAGLEGYAHVVPYNATKFAVRGLMEGLAEEFRGEGRNIKFTTICPFMVDTGLCKKPKIRFDLLLGMLQPDQVAATIIKAQRQGLREISIPGYIRGGLLLLKLLPIRASEAIHNFMDTGLYASDA